jgi:hypothetical protein
MRTTVILSLVTVMTMMTSPAPFRFTLPPGCTLPFAAIAPAKDAFVSCDHAGRMDGVLVPTLAQRLQTGVKNNLCASATDPIQLRIDTLDSLPQPPASIVSTSRNGISNIVPLTGHWLGEGHVIQLAGYIKRAHVHNCGPSGERQIGSDLVKCGLADGDIETSEIELVLQSLEASPDADECESLTAKIIPHYRPAAWSRIDLATPQLPVRITGQAFYDDSNPSCQKLADGRWLRRGTLARRTSWEIHPVYAIDVCVAKNVADCHALDDANLWVPYHDWIRGAGIAIHATGRRERELCEETASKAKAHERSSHAATDHKKKDVD